MVAKRKRKDTTTAQYFDAKHTIPDTNRTIIIWAPRWNGRPFTGNLMGGDWFDFSSHDQEALPWETGYRMVKHEYVLSWAEMPLKPKEGY